MTRIQLDNGFIDVEVDIPITIAFNDVTKRGSRTGGYSNTIEVQGTANNIKMLGMYFDVDLETTTFNRNIKTACSIIQDGVEVFDGFIQLLEINRVNVSRTSNRKKIVYTVFVFDEIGNFFNQMGNKELTDLNLNDLNHTFNRTNIIESWANTEGYIYPQFAKSDSNYTLRDFKPAVFEWEYFKRIFEYNGYQFDFPQANIDTIRMNKRIVPYNGKVSNDVLMQSLVNAFKFIGEQDNYTHTLPATAQPLGRFLNVSVDVDQVEDYIAFGEQLDLTEIQDIQNQYNTTTDTFTNLAGVARTITFNSQYAAIVTLRGVDSFNASVAWDFELLTGTTRVELYCVLVVQSLTDITKTLLLGVNQPVKVWSANEGFPNAPVTLNTVNIQSFGQLGLFDLNEEFQITPLVFAQPFGADGLPQSPIGNYQTVDSLNNQIRVEIGIELQNLTLTNTTDVSELVAEAQVDMNAFIPTKIKQRDFINTIAKTYNLFFISDEIDPQKIRIVTRDKYLDDAEEWDWTSKFAENQNSPISFLSNQVARGQNYLYKEDKDTANTAYQDQTQRTFGDARLTLDNEYTKGDDNNELIYSPTPSIFGSVGMPLPAINGINPNNNVRVLLNNGVKDCLPYTFWNNILPQGDGLTVQECLHTSMYDNDNTPNFSIMFDSPLFLFHATQISQTSNYLCNLHHKREVTTLNSGKMLVGYFQLTNLDIQLLSKTLAYKVFIRDNGWFYINKIDKYNAGKQTLTRVELITLDDETDLKFINPPFNPPTANQNTNNVVQQHLNAVGLSTNVTTVQDVPTIQGMYNVISARGAVVVGNSNTVRAANVTIIGNGNNIFRGAENSRVLSDNARIETSSVIVGGRNINQDIITLDIESALFVEFVAAFDFVVDSIFYLTTTTTATIEVNGNPYNFGEQINITDIVRVDVAANTTINLNIIR